MIIRIQDDGSRIIQNTWDGLITTIYPDGRTTVEEVEYPSVECLDEITRKYQEMLQQYESQK